jgi:hypothetical protein
LGGIAGGYEGKVEFLINASGQAFTISHASAGSAVENRIFSKTAADVAVGAGQALVELYYYNGQTHWNIVSVGA